MQVASGEIWGRASRMGGGFLCVKAYRNGIAFTTTVAPDRFSGSPFEARWYYPATPGVVKRVNAQGEEFAAIPAEIVNLQP